MVWSSKIKLSPFPKTNILSLLIPSSTAISACNFNIWYSPWAGIKYLGFNNFKFIFNSCLDGWPEEWISLKIELVITSAPQRVSWLTTLEIECPFPGIGLEENTTVSPGTILISFKVPFAILLKAAIGSPWLPVQSITRSLSLMPLKSLVSTIQLSGILM